MESWFLEPSVSRISRYLEPNLVSLGFAWLKLYNFTPVFSNPQFLETPGDSSQFWLPPDKLTLDNWNLRKFPNHLVRVSITFTSLPPFLLIHDFGKQNTRGNVSKISVSFESYWQIGSKSTNHSPIAWRREG